ncbi:LOW QUALITY PROTEIN: hypothetical protein PHMEG_00023786 [Phytophthora megakarya]|uniref:Uncharacterized protein n=1 Tax=Phytophthora megakarya TaxID=4795 RepID=A0A225VG55_9STRA|nr:LOW QUALITY PROTEIN: hypothetical protein PHMEG_00023786 [Phytophthora megakarya]
MVTEDVTSALRNYSQSQRTLFAGRIEIEDVVVIDFACPFGWTEYEVIGGAVAFVHGKHGNRHSPTGFFKYHWVDDHVNVAVEVETNCQT